MADTIWGTGRRLDDCLFSKAYEFEFFQAVRLLTLLADEQGAAAKDALRFRVHPSMSFPPSPVVAVDRGLDDGAARITVAFLGLVGPLGVLPDRYTEMAVHQKSFGDESFAEFFDVFHNRLLALFYRAWEKHQFVIGQERAGRGRDAVTTYLLDLIGMGTAGLGGRLPFADEALLRYAGLLAQRPRSAECLRAMLTDWLGFGVAVEQFRGRWHELEVEDLCALGDEGANCQLGEGAVAGDEVWTRQSLIRVVLGPLEAADFFTLLPDGKKFAEVSALVRWFLGPVIDFELQPVLARGVMPVWGALGATSGDTGVRSRLGWSSWLAESPFAEPAGDAVFAEDEHAGVKEWQWH